MSKSIEALAQTIQAMRPMLPAKDFARNVKFYVDLGFQQRTLTDGLAEMTLGACSFLLQDYYVREWADNLVIHLFVSDLDSWWAHIVALDLPSRYGVKTRVPQLEDWGVRVAGVIDPSGVLWRLHEVSTGENHTDDTLSIAGFQRSFTPN
jgi:uncharacterized glyoxalase superfamily protein PhnB